MNSLLEHVIDSFEKLDVIVHLYRIRSCAQTSSIVRTLHLSPRSVAEALAALLHAGVVRTLEQDDGAGWWFDSRSSWAKTIEVLVEIYEMDPAELLRLMKDVAFEHVRTRRALGASFPATRKRRKPADPS